MRQSEPRTITFKEYIVKKLFKTILPLLLCVSMLLPVFSAMAFSLIKITATGLISAPDDGINDVTVIFGGDADGDGTLTLGDALAIMRTAIGVAPEFGDNIGDMNANGDINLDDAITLARICIGVY